MEPATVSMRVVMTFQPEAYNSLSVELGGNNLPLNPSKEQINEVKKSWAAYYKIAGQEITKLGREALADWRDVKHEHEVEQAKVQLETKKEIEEMSQDG